MSASWTIRRTSASVRAESLRHVALDDELGPDAEPVGEVVDIRVEHLGQRGTARGRVDPEGHHCLAGVGKGRIERAHHFPAGRPRRVLELRRLDDAALLQLGVPQVLRQPIVDLAGQPGTLGDAGTCGVDVAQPAELRVRSPQGREVRLQFRLNPQKQDRGEHQPKDVTPRDDPDRHDGIHREVELAECGDHETDGKERVRGEPFPDVQPAEQQRGREVEPEDDDLEDGDDGALER